MSVEEKQPAKTEEIKLLQFLPETNSLNSVENLIPLLIGDILLKIAHYQGYKIEWSLQISEQIFKQLQTNPQSIEILNPFGIGISERGYTPAFHGVSEENIKQQLAKWESQGLLRQESRPIPWSTQLKRSLTSEEIQYQNQLEQTYYLKIPLKSTTTTLEKTWPPAPIFLLVYGKQPYTLVDTSAYTLHPERTYVAAEVMEEIWIFAESRLEFLRQHLNFQEDRLLERIPSSQLLPYQAKHPLIDAWIPLIATSELRLDEGTGCFPFTPGHVPQEYDLAYSKKMPIPYSWEIDGSLTKASCWPAWQGKTYHTLPIEILNQLGKTKLLLKLEEQNQNYPFCKLSQTSILYRPVPGVFLDLTSQDLRGQILDTLRRIRWKPEGETQSLPQDLSSGQALRLSRGEEWEPWLKQASIQEKKESTSTFSQWLLSDKTHGQLIWFFSQLLKNLTQTPALIPERAFLYAARRVSETELNLEPEAFRLWVASQALGKKHHLTSTNQDMAKKLWLKFRHTLKNLTESLLDFQPAKNWMPLKERGEADQWILLELNQQLEKVSTHYQNFSYHRAVQSLAYFFHFLRRRYLRWSHDHLFFSDSHARERHSIQSTLWEIAQYCFPYLAPLLPHSVQEFWQQLPKAPQSSSSLWQQKWSLPTTTRESEVLKTKFQQILWVIRGVERALAQALSQKKLQHPLQAQIHLSAQNNAIDLQRFLQSQILNWPKYLRVSQVVVVYEIEKATLVWNEKDTPATEGQELAIEVLLAEGQACTRCGIYSITVVKSSEISKLCERCSKIKTVYH